MKYNIAHFGAFDIDSLGDSLFVTILKNELSSRISIDNHILFSINHIDNAYNNNGVVYSYGEFDKISESIKFDAIIIGGGELLHYNKINFNQNSLNNKFSYTPGELWKFPILKGKELNIPIILNCVGVPYDIEDTYLDDFINNLNNISYLSVRDYFSYNRVSRFLKDLDNVKIIPDTVFNLDNIYSKDALEKHFNSLNLDKNFDKSKEYICIQYGTTYKINELISQIQKVYDEYKYQIVLLPINYCHEDVNSLIYIKEKINNDNVFFFDELKPKDIISVISNSKLFAGTSFHGNLIATTYNVKSLGLDMYHTFVSKIDGLFHQLDMQQYIVPSPNGFFSSFIKLHNDEFYLSKCSDKLNNNKMLLNNHFDDIANIIKNKPSEKLLCIDKCKFLQPKKYKKAFIKYDTDNEASLKYSFSESNNNLYTFEFYNINSNTVEVNFFSDNPCEIKIISCISENIEYVMESQNAFKSAKNADIFTEQLISYKINSDNIINELKVVCEMNELDKDDSHNFLKQSIINKTAHIELLLESERNLTYKLNNALQEIKALKEQKQKLEERDLSIKYHLRALFSNIKRRILK